LTAAVLVEIDGAAGKGKRRYQDHGFH